LISGRVIGLSFLERVRLGVLRPGDPRIVQFAHVVDQQLGYSNPNGPFWHRASFDGYGEKGRRIGVEPSRPTPGPASRTAAAGRC
jgi:hypothetical protein